MQEGRLATLQRSIAAYYLPGYATIFFAVALSLILLHRPPVYALIFLVAGVALVVGSIFARRTSASYHRFLRALLLIVGSFLVVDGAYYLVRGEGRVPAFPAIVIGVGASCLALSVGSRRWTGWAPPAHPPPSVGVR